METRKKVYTICYGYLDCDDDYICTNEVSFLLSGEYNKALNEILLSSVNNFSQKGYWIECYCDEEELTDEELLDIENYCSMVEPTKATMIQEFLIRNYKEEGK